MTELIPNLIIAGAPKCGTTSLFDWLSQHPEVCASSVKETYFLMDKGYPLYRSENNYHQNGIKGYKSFFTDCDENRKLVLEATPDYLYQNTALEVIEELSSTSKVLFVLRKPSDRVYSLFQFARNNISVIDNEVSFSSFVKAVMGEDPQGIIQNRPILQNAIKHSQYVDYLEPWIARMGGRVQVELFEDMTADPRLFMMNLADQLGIDDTFFEIFDFSSKNKTYAVKNQLMHIIKRKLSLLLPGGVFRQVLRNIYVKLNTEQPPKKTPEDIEALNMLDAHFTTSNDNLEFLTGCDLSPWRST